MDFHKLLEYRNIISKRMDCIASDEYMDINIDYLKYIHKYLFDGIIPNCGEYRYYNLYRRETILNDNSISYEDYHTIDYYLRCEFDRIHNTDFLGLDDNSKIEHIMMMIINIWIIHPFNDGNTRSLIIFIKKYLNYYGYDVDYKYFKDNILFFRNAIVRAIYENSEYDVIPNNKPLYNFIYNLINDDKIKLNNYDLTAHNMFINKGKGKKKVKK